MIANTSDAVSPVRETRVPSVPAVRALLPYAALIATVVIWQLGGIVGLAALARGANTAGSTVDYPSLSHRS